jgi:hypothetical protein
MPTTSSSVVFAASLCAVAAAQDAARSAIPAPALAEALSGGGGPLRADSVASRLPPQDEPDYSLRGLFQQEHGDFMLQRERFNPMIEVRAGAYLDSAVEGETGRFDLYRGFADVEVPLPVSTDAYVSLGAYFDSRRYQTRNMAGFADETLYATGVKLGFGWFVDPDILIEGKIAPSVFSDWDGTLHNDDFDFPCGVLATVRYSPEMFFKVGARYNEVFEEANGLPWLGFSWAGETVRVDILLPESAEVSLWPTPDFGILFGALIEGAEYHVRTTQALGSQQGDARVQEVNIYAGAMWRLTDQASLDARAGVAVAGDYKLEDGDPSTSVVDGTLEPTFFFHVGFGLDF